MKYGGEEGIRDITLLCSAVAMPYSSFGGEFFHKDIFEMAAAYAFHICRNHPFIDGNKRTALASALVFFEMNGITISDPKGKLYENVLLIATGGLDKQGFAQVLKELATGKG